MLIKILKYLPKVDNFELIHEYKDWTYNRVVVVTDYTEIVGVALIRVSVNLKLIEVIALEAVPRNKGIGTKIINYLKEIARRKQASILLTSLRSSLGFYLKLGFEPLDGAISDTIMMWKPSYDYCQKLPKNNV